MSATIATTHFENPGVLSALEALRSPANIALAAISGVLSLLIQAGAVSMLARGHSILLALIVSVFALLIGLAGYCAVTLRRLEASHGTRSSGMVSAAVAGFLSAIKVLLAMLMMALGLIVLMLAAALLLAITQIPGIGPALNYVIFPVVALVLGVAIYTLLFIALPLASVAACDGRSVFGSVATVMVVIRNKLFDVALRGILVWLIAFVVVALATSIVSMGTGASGAIQHMVHSSSNTSSYGGLNEMAGMIGGPLQMLAPLFSAGAASMILYFIAASLGFVAYAGGWVTIFNDTARDLDPAALEARMRTQAERIQRTAREAQARAAQIAKEHAAKSTQSSNPDAGTPRAGDRPHDP